MKKMLVWSLMLFGLTFAANAAYVNYTLTPFYGKMMDFEKMMEVYIPRDFSMGYYLMLIDGAYSQDLFKSVLPDGSSGSDIGNIPKSSVLYQDFIYSETGSIDVNTSASTGYLALFTTAELPVNDTYYTLYSVKNLTDSTNFNDSTVWTNTTVHLFNLQNSIPEPSSGLLMLAGFSLLALKRKRRACVFC